MNGKMKTMIIGAVAASLIAATSVTAFAATGSTAQAGPQCGVRNGNAAASAGLTVEQHTALHDATQANFNTALSALVADGSITQAQADAIVSATDRRMANGDLTADQRTMLRDAMAAARTDALNSLVAAGTITQDQADILGTMGNKGHMERGSGKGSGMQDGSGRMSGMGRMN